MKYITAFFEIVNHPLNKKTKLKTVIRLLWWYFNKKFLKIPSIINIYDDVKCICYPNSSYGSLVVYCKLPEYHEMRLILDLIKEDNVFLDVGANIGVYSVLAASKTKKGKVYAFEPSQTSFENLKDNVAINGMGNKIIPVNLAVSDNSSKEIFINSEETEVSHISYDGAKSDDDRRVLVDATNLDKYFSNKRVKGGYILKVDVEGAELKVLKGAKKLLEKRKIDILMIELNNKSFFYGFTPRELLDLLIKYNFEIFTADKNIRDYFKSGFNKLNYTANVIAVHRRSNRVLKIKEIIKRNKYLPLNE